MANLTRLSLSLETPLLTRFEALVRESGYGNRSEFVRDMIREKLVEREWKHDQEVIGTLTIVYDHEVRMLSQTLTHLQHHHHREILATTHVHLNEQMCAEMMLMKGKGNVLQHIADTLRQQKGVLHAVLSLSSTGLSLE